MDSRAKTQSAIHNIAYNLMPEPISKRHTIFFI